MTATPAAEPTHDNAVEKHQAIPPQHMRTRMGELVDTLEHQDIQTEFRITSKSARFEILRFAKAHAVDLIVVAPHGQGVIGTLGSTAPGILNNASCDVLAVRESNNAAL